MANVGVGVITVQAGSGEDVINVTNSGGGVDLFGGDDNDLFNITNNGSTINAFGEVGDDTYVVDLSGNALVNIVDSVNAENDTLLCLLYTSPSPRD